MDNNLKDLDENLAWLTQKTVDLKGIKGTLLSPPPPPPTHTHTVNVIDLNCKVIKKWQPPISTSTSPHFSGLSPLSGKKFCNPPQVIQFLEGCTPLL